MKKAKLTIFAKMLIVVVVVGSCIGLYKFSEKMGWLDQIAPQKGNISLSKSSTNDKDTLRIGVVTWGGYAGGEYFNGGFKASEESRFYKEYGLKVEFIVNDDFVPSREAWKADQVDILWGTADSFPIEAAAMSSFNPKIIFQADWSRGGDAIVARRGITKVSDLKGKKIAFAFGTPSHTFLLWLLEANDMTQKDITPVETDSAVQAATFFKSGKVDAAVVWSPDDEDCLKNVSGASVLKSTREASKIIADIFFVKESFLDKNKDKVTKFVEGFLKGAAEINSNKEAKEKAARILADGLNISEDFAMKSINNVRLATYGDNLKFFGIDLEGNPVTGESLYSSMSQTYSSLGIAQGNIPNWRKISDASIIKSISLIGSIHSAEGIKTFAPPTEKLKTAEAFSTKRITISFASGSFVLDDNAKYTIQMKFADIAKAFSNSRIRIEGNTDNVGSLDVNKVLSLRRAKSVAEFLAKEYHFDHNRFIIIGNGPNKPIADNATEEGRSKNRRTDFELISE